MIFDHASAQRFDAQRQRRHVEQQHFLGRFRAARQGCGLHGRAQRNHFIGIQVAVRRALEKLFDQLADPRDARRSAHQHGFVDLLRGQPGIFHRLPHWADSAIDHRLDQLLELRARDLALIALAAGKLDIERRLLVRRQRDLRLDHRLANRLHDLGIAADIDAEIALDIVERDRDQQVVDVVAAEVGVAVGGDHLEDALVQLENRNVKRAAAEVVNRNGSVFFLSRP